MSKGILLILSGASSVGKKAIRDLLLNDPDLNLTYSISMTTRPKKEKEKDHVDYIFVNYDTFSTAVKNKDFIEYTEFDGFYYGTLKEQVEKLLEDNKNVLIEVEAQGVGQIKLSHPESLSVFVKPKNMEELEKQIKLRYNDTDNAQRRISKASVEMALAPLFENVVDNTNPEEAAHLIKRAVLAMEKVYE